MHQCKLVGDVSYTLSSAATSTLSAPCTNRPIKCELCALTIWSYSMAEHYATAQGHGGADRMSEPLRKAVAVGPRERAHVSRFLTSLRPVQNACADRDCACQKTGGQSGAASGRGKGKQRAGGA